MNKVWLYIFFLSLIYGIFTGRVSELSNLILTIPSESIKLVITLVGSACFWSGVVSVLKECGVISYITKKLKPFLRIIMPNLDDEYALECVSSNIACNMLGLGYGATPSGLKAIKRMQELNKNDKSEASDEMVTFLILNTAGVTIIPTTVISIRSSLGSVNPCDILFLPIIATFMSCLSGLLIDYYYRKRKKK